MSVWGRPAAGRGCDSAVAGYHAALAPQESSDGREVCAPRSHWCSWGWGLPPPLRAALASGQYVSRSSTYIGENERLLTVRQAASPLSFCFICDFQPRFVFQVDANRHPEGETCQQM